MSLVDYASSDEEEAELPQNHHPRDETKQLIIQEAIYEEQQQAHRSDQLPVPKDPSFGNKPSRASSSKQKDDFSRQSVPSNFRLPDASLLLNSPAMPSHLLLASDHTSRVAVAMAESASRKRDLDGSSSSLPRSKVPKETLGHSKSLPDKAKGLLIPPQLTGRSNVVTEDISKLFVKKHVDSSSQ